MNFQTLNFISSDARLYFPTAGYTPYSHKNIRSELYPKIFNPEVHDSSYPTLLNYILPQNYRCFWNIFSNSLESEHGWMDIDGPDYKFNNSITILCRPLGFNIEFSRVYKDLHQFT